MDEPTNNQTTDRPSHAWLSIMPIITLARGVSLTHVCGDRTLDRVCVKYNKAVLNWMCSSGGSTPSYRVDLEDDLSFVFAALTLARLGGCTQAQKKWVMGLLERATSHHPARAINSYDRYALADALRKVA